MDEHYHSTFGAVNESRHIFIDNGLRRFKGKEARILEVGFGTGLNAFLTAIACEKEGLRVSYTAIEKFPLAKKEWSVLNYPEIEGGGNEELFREIHSCGWGSINRITGSFFLEKIKLDLVIGELTGIYDIVYFDAFGPDKQPEMWSDDIFRKISSCTEREGILSTYSAKGSVKRSLAAAGFRVYHLPGPAGKRQITMAIKL